MCAASAGLLLALPIHADAASSETATAGTGQTVDEVTAETAAASTSAEKTANTVPAGKTAKEKDTTAKNPFEMCILSAKLIEVIPDDGSGKAPASAVRNSANARTTVFSGKPARFIFGDKLSMVQLGDEPSEMASGEMKANVVLEVVPVSNLRTGVSTLIVTAAKTDSKEGTQTVADIPSGQDMVVHIGKGELGELYAVITPVVIDEATFAFMRIHRP